MKANEAPEKIYIQPSTIEQLPHQNIVYTKPLADNSIEYTRTDAFIEKACEWLKNSTYGYLTEKWGEIELDRETLSVDFAKYMKGE